MSVFMSCLTIVFVPHMWRQSPLTCAQPRSIYSSDYIIDYRKGNDHVKETHLNKITKEKTQA